jgi:hypothetical protein
MQLACRSGKAIAAGSQALSGERAPCPADAEILEIAALIV